MLRIVADENIPFLKGILEPFAEVVYRPGRDISPEILRKADGLLIRTRTKCTAELLNGTSVRFIGTATIGYDHIDTQYCEANGIRWVNAPGCNSSSVQQYIAAALLKMSQEFRFRLRDKTIGIIGAGNVGSKVEKLCRLFGMNVLVNDPPRVRREGEKGFSTLEAVLAESDIITLHVPLAVVGEDKTWHLVNDRLIRKMKKGVWIINSSRGEVADTSSLKKALNSGRVAGLIADVWENEPDIDQDLMQRSFIATPHIAGYSTDGKANGTAMVIGELASHFGLPVSNWYPEELPAPSNPSVVIRGKGKDREDIFREAVDQTYSISEDDLRLRFSPADFEKQRGEYRVRREFPAFSLNISDCSASIINTLRKLGFNNS